MRRFLFIFILIPFSFVGQHLLPIMHDTLSANHELILNGVGNYSSSSIRTDLAKKLLYGGEIGQDLIDASALNHRSINRFGIYLNSEVEYRNRQANFLFFFLYKFFKRKERMLLSLKGDESKLSISSLLL